jgi:hypothetical protein
MWNATLKRECGGGGGGGNVFKIMYYVLTMIVDIFFRCIYDDVFIWYTVVVPEILADKQRRIKTI